MYKVVRIGVSRPEWTKRGYSIFCKIEIKDGVLSISGVEGSHSSGHCRGSCGQIDMHDWNITQYAKGWNPILEDKFRKVWERWHLNDLRAGTPKQMEILKQHKFPGYPKSHYEWALEILDQHGLVEDNGYRYGSAWLREELPEDVVQFLSELPDSDKDCSWYRH